MTLTLTTNTLKERALARRDREAADLLGLSHALHAEPELAFEEHKSVRRVVEPLVEAGFDVEMGAYGLPTAFTARFGSGLFTVLLCAEYDALPGLGHACGHNIIAASAVGTALFLAEVAEELDLTVEVIGTPAEEGGGGKVLLLEAGAFDEGTIAGMVHPFSGTDVACAKFDSQAVEKFSITYKGRGAHPATNPTHAISAHTAATVAHVAFGLIRHQLSHEVSINAYTKHGGSATNIIPAETVIDVEVRAYDMEELAGAKRKVLACFEAGAIASGCTWSVETTMPQYASLVQDPRLAALWDDNFLAIGRVTGERGHIGGSTDMGNVTRYMPAIHPGIAIPGTRNVNHDTGYVDDVVSPAGDQTVLDIIAVLGGTIIDAASHPGIRAELLAQQAERSPYKLTD